MNKDIQREFNKTFDELDVKIGLSHYKLLYFSAALITAYKMASEYKPQNESLLRLIGDAISAVGLSLEVDGEEHRREVLPECTYAHKKSIMKAAFVGGICGASVAIGCLLYCGYNVAFPCGVIAGLILSRMSLWLMSRYDSKEGGKE